MCSVDSLSVMFQCSECTLYVPVLFVMLGVLYHSNKPVAGAADVAHRLKKMVGVTVIVHFYLAYNLWKSAKHYCVISFVICFYCLCNCCPNNHMFG